MTAVAGPGVCNPLVESKKTFLYEITFVLSEVQFHEDLTNETSSRYQELSTAVVTTARTAFRCTLNLHTHT